jgi:phenylalanyl-tRNA synthetase alpha chain
MPGQIEELIHNLQTLNGAALLHATQQIANLAEAEAKSLWGPEESKTFVARWFGREPGLFWTIFEQLEVKAPNDAVWASWSVRKLLKLPADRIISWGMWTDNPEQAFGFLFDYLQTVIGRAENPLRLGAVKNLWESRTEGVKADISEHWLRKAPPNIKSAVGRRFNDLSATITAQLESQKRLVEATAEEQALARERVDLSLPGVIRPIGTHHLIRQVFQEIEDIFFSIGFSVVEGPEIETSYYNFEALNIPEFHPVRDDMDTFYLELPKGALGPLLLRTHTSPVQIRTMEKRQPPVRVIVPGKVYRRDNPDATHSFMFHQIEGLAVDSDITFCDFTGTIDYFVKQFFGENVKTRFRPSYFPFTEPSVEFDASCIFCGGTGTAKSGGTCGKCKGAGWIELFGAGMVDPAVYGFVNYDAKKVSGFAFGIGIDRLAMLKYGIDDIQAFFQNDVRFLRQFP